MTDARTLNWRFLLPVEPVTGLLLPAGDERLEGDLAVCPRNAEALRAATMDGRHAAVLAPDLTGWARSCRMPAAALLLGLAAATAERGVLYVGFANAAFPSGRGRRARLTPARACRLLRAAGLQVGDVYVALPSQRLPAVLVPARDAELRHVLGHQTFAFSASRSRWTGPPRQAAMRLMRAAALAAPAGLRLRLAPAYGVVAVRPSGGSP